MEKVKTRNKKYIAAILALCFALVAMLGAVVGIWAATTQGVSTAFNVNYSVGNNVAAKVRTEKYVPNLDEDEDGEEDGVITVAQDSNENPIETDNNGYVVFDAAAAERAEDVYIGKVMLNPYAKKAYFYFSVESLLSSGYVRVLCNPTYTTIENINVDISYYNIDTKNTFTPAVSAASIAEENWTKAHYNNIPAGGFKFIRIAIAVENVNQSASCGGNINLTFDYSNVTGLQTLDDTTKSTIQSSTATEMVFAYAEEAPEGAVEATAVKPMADSDPKIWTKMVGSTLYIYSNHTIDMPADCSLLFANRTALTSLDFTNFNTSNVTNMKRMFYKCGALSNLKLDNFDTSKVTSMEDMFYYASSLTSLDLSHFDTSSVTTMLGMFSDCVALQQLNLSNFDTSNVTTMEYMFYKCNALLSLDLSSFNTEKVTSMKNMFYKCNLLENVNVSSFDTTEVTTMQAMFRYCGALKSVDVAHFNTAKVQSMQTMFANCPLLEYVDVSNWNTESVTNMICMFTDCNLLKNLDVSNFNTQNVTGMWGMFSACQMLENLDVSNFDTSNVTDMRQMFYYCEKLTNLDVSGFDTSKVGTGTTDDPGSMKEMFDGCFALESLDVTSFNTENVTDMWCMFGNCESLKTLDLSSFNTAKVTDFRYMFDGCSMLKTIYANDQFVISSSAQAGNMFDKCYELVGAISFDETKTHGATYANYTTGYFTYKAPEAAA